MKHFPAPADAGGQECLQIDDAGKELFAPMMIKCRIGTQRARIVRTKAVQTDRFLSGIVLKPGDEPIGDLRKLGSLLNLCIFQMSHPPHMRRKPTKSCRAHKGVKGTDMHEGIVTQTGTDRNYLLQITALHAHRIKFVVNIHMDHSAHSLNAFMIAENTLAAQSPLSEHPLRGALPAQRSKRCR